MLPESGGWYNRTMARLAVIIPARNEASNLPSVLADIARHIPDAHVIVVDDHSEDGTATVASALPGCTVVSAPISLGIGGAVQLGIKYALGQGYDLFLRMDGDGQHRAESGLVLLAAWKPGILVQGSRSHADFAASSNWLRKLGSLYFHFLFRAFASQDLPDPTSGMMCFGRDVAAKFAAFYPLDFPEIESLVLLLRSGHAVVSAPVAMRPRQAGESSIHLLHAAIYMLSVTIAFFSTWLRKNPYGAAHATA